MANETKVINNLIVDDAVEAWWLDGKRISRRQLITGLAGAMGAAALGKIALAQAVPEDTTKVAGRSNTELSERSDFEKPRRKASGSYYPTGRGSRLTPQQYLDGIVTPNDLHFSRTHSGWPELDPAKYKLLVHGSVARPMMFTLADLLRYPRISRFNFVECQGNKAGSFRGPTESSTAQDAGGHLSTSQWTGVMLSTIFQEVGISRRARWVIFESYDGAAMARSWPLNLLWEEGYLAYGQNGEPVRREQGYPVRLMVPGSEGNSNVKWLRRMEITEEPLHGREEANKYTDIRCDEERCIVTQFTFVMECNSEITFPSTGHKLTGPGLWEIHGLAWSGRGKIEKVEVSTDGGKTWGLARIEEPIFRKASTRFRYLWKWDGEETIIVSRATDETGYVQPTREELLAYRGSFGAHANHTLPWKVRRDGTVVMYVPPNWPPTGPAGVTGGG